MFDVKNRNVIITGASRGFGYEFSRRLAMAGAKVCMTDIDLELGQKSAEKIRTMFGRDEKSVFFIKCDVSQAEDWTAMWYQAEGVFTGPVDILCNNAGTPARNGWELCLNVMSIGLTRGIMMALDRMGSSKGGRGGRIINIASVAGLTLGFIGGIPKCGYEISKWGNIAVTRLFEAAKPTPFETDGIKCYALCPWYADTEFIRPVAQAIVQQTKERLLTPEEVADAMMTSLELDRNGAVYMIYPDAPMIEYASVRNHVFFLHVLLGKLAAHLGIRVLTPAHFYAMAAFGLWLCVVLVNKLFWFLME